MPTRFTVEFPQPDGKNLIYFVFDTKKEAEEKILSLDASLKPIIGTTTKHYNKQWLLSNKGITSFIRSSRMVINKVLLEMADNNHLKVQDLLDSGWVITYKYKL